MSKKVRAVSAPSTTVEPTGLGNTAGALLPEATVGAGSVEEAVASSEGLHTPADAVHVTLGKNEVGQTAGLPSPKFSLPKDTPESDQICEEAFRAKYPLTAAALDKLSVLGKSSWTLRVKSKQAGFRRGGIAHPEAATDHALAEMHPDQVEAILGEPMLDAELL